MKEIEKLELEKQILELKDTNNILRNSLKNVETENLKNKVDSFNSLFTQEGVNLLIELNEKYKTLYQTINIYTKVVLDIEKETRFIQDLLTGRMTIKKQEKVESNDKTGSL